MNRNTSFRKVLIIAYPFPPMGGSGVQRTVKFAKYLPQFGWQPVILTVKNPPLCEADPSLLDEVPAPVEIHRTWSFEPHRLFRLKNERGSVDDLNTGQDLKPAKREGFFKALFRKIKRFINTWVFIPDREIGWFPFALIRGMRIMRRSKIDVIYSTSDPFTDHLTGYILKKLTRKPWVADFRDPWTKSILYYYSPSKFRQIVDVVLEKRFLNAADKIIVVSQPMMNDFLRAYPNVDRAKFIQITNGFDSSDFKNTGKTVERNEKFTITFAGRFSNPITFSPYFLKALSSLVENDSRVKKELRAVFVGDFGPKAWKLLRGLSLEEVVEVIGYVPHHRSVEYIKQADVLLLPINHVLGHECVYSAKLFEYLAARKPILALVTEGVAASLIREMQAGVIVPPGDLEAIKEAISLLYEKHISNCLELTRQPSLERFERYNLTKSLAQCLYEVAV